MFTFSNKIQTKKNQNDKKLQLKDLGNSQVHLFFKLKAKHYKTFQSCLRKNQLNTADAVLSCCQFIQPNIIRIQIALKVQNQIIVTLSMDIVATALNQSILSTFFYISICWHVSIFLYKQQQRVFVFSLSRNVSNPKKRSLCQYNCGRVPKFHIVNIRYISLKVDSLGIKIFTLDQRVADEKVYLNFHFLCSTS